MKLRHNKKRNTAFLYEVLVREMVKTVIHKDVERKSIIIEVIKEHFNKKTCLARELDLYDALINSINLESRTAEKLIQEVKRNHRLIDKKQLFIEQSTLISKINKALSKETFSNFVPNYKTLATIAQIFNGEASTKSRVLLEETIYKRLIAKTEEEQSGKFGPVSNLVYKTFIKKFNETYSEKLFEEQKTLLNNYVSSFSNNGIELKLFMNEEIERLREIIKETLKTSEIQADEAMKTKTKNVLSLIESYKDKPIDKTMIGQVLKIQNLAREAQN